MSSSSTLDASSPESSTVAESVVRSETVGARVGSGDGRGVVGSGDGCDVGSGVGWADGSGDGSGVVGSGDGTAVGTDVGSGLG